MIRNNSSFKSMLGLIFYCLFFTISCNNNIDDTKYDDSVKLQISYYNNGKVKSKGAIINGDTVGLWINYYENGHVSSELIFIDGKINGSYNMYFDNGNIKREGVYKNDLPIGYHVFYDYFGGKKMEGNYLNGEFDSIWNFYYDGQLDKKVRYSNGKKIEIIIDNLLTAPLLNSDTVGTVPKGAF